MNLNSDYHATFIKQREDWEVNQNFGPEILLGKVSIDNLNMNSLEESCFEILKKHESLRTIFILKEDTLYQYVHKMEKYNDFSSEYINVKLFSEKKWAREQELKMGNLSEGPLFKVFILDHNSTKSTVYLILHHIIADEWSMTLLISDFISFYNSLQKNEKIEFPALPIQLKEYSKLKNEELAVRQLKTKTYWSQRFDKPYLYVLQQRLADLLALNKTQINIREPDLNIVILEKLNSPNSSFQYTYSLKEETAAQLQGIFINSKVSIPMMLISILGIIFNRIDGMKEIMISTIIADRSRKQTKELITNLTAGVYIRSAIRGQDTLLETLNNIYLEFIQSMRHMLYSYKDFRQLPLRSASLLHLNYIDLSNSLNESFPDELKSFSKITNTKINQTYYPLGIDVLKKDQQIALLVKYNSMFYSKKQVEHLCTTLSLLVERLYLNPDSRIEELSIEKWPST